MTSFGISCAQGRRDAWHRDGDRISLVRPARASRPADLDAEPAPLTLDLARSALVVVDMQNDFLSPEGWFAADRGADPTPLLEVVPRINALGEAARAAGVPVVHLNWGVRADALNLPANVRDKASDCGARRGYADERPARGPVLVSGSWGARSLEAIRTAADDIHVAKHRLSGFHDNEFEAILRRLDVTTLIYCGVNTDRCVFATLADGCFRGFDAVLVEDACATPSPSHVGDAILYLVRLLYGATAKTDALLAALSRATEEGANP